LLKKKLMAAIRHRPRRSRGGKESALSATFCEMQMPRLARHDTLRVFFFKLPGDDDRASGQLDRRLLVGTRL
jgi:hypothetical protein